VTKARFAPSPTGLLHIGNARSALINWAYIKKIGGEFILRIDDTDLARSKTEYENFIKENLTWLGINWSKTFNQSNRLDLYNKIFLELKNKKRIYPCFETEEELSLKRKSLLSAGKPPIYDRSGLHLDDNQIKEHMNQGKKPHWRFKLDYEMIEWEDLIKGKISFNSRNMSDPILIRENGSFLYHLPSVVDDIEEKITHIIRGEDHINNTAFHIQLFKSLDNKVPEFGHHPFLTDEKGKGFGKRLGSASIEDLKNEGFESITLANYLLSIGTSQNLTKELDINKIIEKFDINNLATSSPKYSINELKILNKEILQIYNFSNVKEKFTKNNYDNISENFWIFVKNNINFFNESFEWIKIINSDEIFQKNKDEYLDIAANLLPDDPFNIETWEKWTNLLQKQTGKKGKELFLPIRFALTGREKGPEMKYLMPLLTKKQVLKKLGFI